ncbi:hypothetical protein CBR_g17948 [Chara braunii]|uniref:Uncharacterized protein n=1 Tax=Chara braunii TaxID=69332 RepID=A0A388KW58_CHABU|nr:hypothetical protein CBR_g17948 [Chara braunii]|eukprot:GBG74238.1 hypothetical protein CBR_g17948 [Chara braunii]
MADWTAAQVNQARVYDPHSGATLPSVTLEDMPRVRALLDSCYDDGLFPESSFSHGDIEIASTHQTSENAILALKTEIGELKQSAIVKANFKKEIAGLRKEVNSLREQNERVVAEANHQWKSEALWPGNKRGSAAINTPEPSDRGTPKPRWTDNLREVNKWKDEYKNLSTLHRLANLEAEALKKKRAEIELKRMEAEKQVKDLEARMSELTASGDKRKGGGTNLKERLEEVAIRSVRRGQKTTPGRIRGVSVGNRNMGDINNRTEYVEERKKQLRLLRKAGLEVYCKEEGIKLGKVEETISELAEARARKIFGETSEKGQSAKQKDPVVEVSDDTFHEVSHEETEDEQSAEF